MLRFEANHRLDDHESSPLSPPSPTPSHLHPIHSQGAAQLVDTEGRELSSSFDYYVLPANSGNGGGFTYIPTGLRCLNFVAQEHNETLPGTPVLITPRNTSAGIILDSYISIEFNDLRGPCAKRLDWHITNKLPGSLRGQRPHVAAGNEDVTRSPGFFLLGKSSSNMEGYSLQSCVDEMHCKYLGLSAYKDKTLLTISDDEYITVVFRKAHRIRP